MADQENPDVADLEPQALDAPLICGTPERYQTTYVRIDIMSKPTYIAEMARLDKPLVWLRAEIKTPPFSAGACLEAGVLLRPLVDVFQKATQQPPTRVLTDCARRLRLYDQLTRED